MPTLQRIISGGQTGIDQLALEVARSIGLPAGGVAPKGFLTENGPDTRLLDLYGLTEHPSASYPPRTKTNVRESDGTVLFGEMRGGTRLTVESCKKEEKPYLINPTTDELKAWLIKHQIKVLNMAGNRGSGLSVDQLQHYRRILYDAFMMNQRLAVLFNVRSGQWELRGDPFLWDELEEVAQSLVLPKSKQDLSDLLHALINNLIGQRLSPGLHVQIPRYKHGGMSSGVVSADFWIGEAIPLLLGRLQALSHEWAVNLLPREA